MKLLSLFIMKRINHHKCYILMKHHNELQK